MNQVSVAIQEHVATYCKGGAHTRLELAKAIEMPYSTFMTKLNGPSEFSFSEGLKLAKAMRISPDNLGVSPISTLAAKGLA